MEFIGAFAADPVQALPFAEMAKLFFGLKPKRNRVDVYYKVSYHRFVVSSSSIQRIIRDCFRPNVRRVWIPSRTTAQHRFRST